MADEFLPPYSPRPHPPYFTAPSNPRQSSPHRRTIQIQPGDCLEIDEQVRAMGIGRSNERQAALLAESATVMSAGERIYLATSLISLAFSVVRHFAMSVMVDIWSPGLCPTELRKRLDAHTDLSPHTPGPSQLWKRQPRQRIQTANAPPRRSTPR
ncbi:hypothetical protein N657DRAFT_296851 [Parathielavia appendiculata]|uniref:Uncharacterized protein n=1 Tax=Parathielavia appendiculata TaxID=2587402 RepID=A0AAN6U495_9PEZI|nr:hypothetical protein N657DRAFT_296851 [Parathielavia appendiculata]